MYAVIETGGKQYRVEPGDVLNIEKCKVEPGSKIEFDKILVFSDDKKVQIGTPYLDATKVIGNVLENGKAQKVIIFKFKAKKDYRKKQGHRQPYTMIEIDSFLVNGKTVAVKPEVKKEVAEEKPAEINKDDVKAEADTADKPPAAKKRTSKAKTATSETEKKPVKKATSAKEAKVEGEEKPVKKTTTKAANAKTEEKEKPAKKPATKTKKAEKVVEEKPAEKVVEEKPVETKIEKIEE